ncbi:hypothetical protein JQ604_12000 [Bradyrhizobium jicamae]|uniref:hypothetical protein n=1 Tax=Bradyrhizobium jicamae TaxID=280332 RepID=UPI001BA82383|nr:hypothetical protein [Bradyrhizobium jicamae]MBR0752909.1 hypothetical protein [Bradyrhizobium jicamae]
MPTEPKKKTSRSGPRLPAGTKQMLVLMDETVIKQVKIAAIEDGTKMSKAVETAVKEWLARRAASRQPR